MLRDMYLYTISELYLKLFDKRICTYLTMYQIESCKEMPLKANIVILCNTRFVSVKIGFFLFKPCVLVSGFEGLSYVFWPENWEGSCLQTLLLDKK